MWLTVQTLVGKGFNVLGTLALAWLLLPEHFGLVGLTFTVTIFSGLIQQAGLREVLIQRRDRFRRYGNAAFWMSLTAGLVAGGVMLLLAPLAAWFYEPDEPVTLMQLILVLAVASPINALGTVSNARLQSDLRFRAVAAVGVSASVVVITLKVILAAAGLGPFALVVPEPIVAAGRTAVLWRLAPPPVRPSLQLRRWRFLFSDSALVIGAAFFYVLIAQGDYVVLGRLTTDAVVGLYFFAYSVSMQTITLFTQNLTNVLFPTLSRLREDPERQTMAYVRASRLLAMLAVPVCLVQAAVADPLVRLLFEPKWYPTIPMIQLLSVAMALRTVGWPAASLLQSQGRFRTRMYLAMAGAALFFPIVVVGVRVTPRFSELWYAPGIGASLAIVLFYLTLATVTVYVAVRPTGRAWRLVLRIGTFPVIASVVSVGTGWLVANRMPDGGVWTLARLGVTLLLSAGIYLAMVRTIVPEQWAELRDRLASVIARPQRRRQSGHPAD
jgi:O-antigen/teichoic acid export membrane protein